MFTGLTLISQNRTIKDGFVAKGQNIKNRQKGHCHDDFHLWKSGLAAMNYTNEQKSSY